MTSRLLRCAAALVLIAPLAACEAQKSSNPLSPSVAGPIPGVNISAPGLLQPAQGVKFKESQQPIRLVIANASTNGVRPLSYTFEVATDSGFTNKVFARSGVAPGDNNQTSVQLDRLGIGQNYSWRARAEDGANTGPFASSSFEIYPKAAVNAPVAVSPVNNVDAGSTTPTLVVHNAATVGPVGYLGYEFQVATDQAFTQLIAAGVVNEGQGDTTFNSSPLPNGLTYYWRVRATDGETTSAWSIVQAFRTPAPVKPPPPTGSPAPAGNWQVCSSYIGDKSALATCVHDAVNPAAGSVDAAFEVTKRIAWLLRGEGAGLLIKNGGENIVSWQGYSFSAGRICYPDGHIYKVVGDVGGANTASWGDNGFVDRSLYLPAIDPSK
jgi:hypothetical protein